MGTKQGEFPTLYRANDGSYNAWARETTEADVATGRAAAAGDFLVMRDGHGSAQWWQRGPFLELHTAVPDDADDVPETSDDPLTAAAAIDPAPALELESSSASSSSSSREWPLNELSVMAEAIAQTAAELVAKDVAELRGRLEQLEERGEAFSAGDYRPVWILDRLEELRHQLEELRRA